MATEKINIRGVNFDNITQSEAAEILAERLREDSGITAVYTPNSEIIQLCIEQNEYYELINSAEMTVPDGVGVIKAAKILGTPLKEKIPGIELGEKMIAFCAGEGIGVYLLGGKPGVAELAAEKLTEKYPGLKVCGTADGYFKKEGEESEGAIERIRESGARLAFICLGVPVQERWIHDNKEKLGASVRVVMALGGSLDVYSGTVKRAPKFFCNAGLEWFYRLITQPWRLGRMMKLPKFLFGTYRERLKKKG